MTKELFVAKYTRADDGRVEGGQTLVWLGDRHSTPPAAVAASRESAQKSQAAALAAAARSGAPFCEECADLERLRSGKTA